MKLNEHTKVIVALVIFAILYGNFYTILVYAFNFERVLRYALIVLAYAFLYYLLNKKNAIKPGWLIIITFITPVLIDTSTLFINWRQIPLRFPFESTFSILGAILGYLYFDKGKYFIVPTIITIGYLILSHYYFVPEIIAHIEARENKEIYVKNAPAILIGKYLNMNGDTVTIDNTKKCILLDLFFVGCAPCEGKREMLLTLKDKIKDSAFSIYLICSGELTRLEDFKIYCKNNKSFNNFTFLYDFNSNINSTFQGTVNKFPYEIIFSKNKPLITFEGFSKEASEINLQKRLTIINKQLNEK